MEISIQSEIGRDKYKTVVTNHRTQLIADEPKENGGTDLGFSPKELLCSALAVCTSATVRMYADRKEWPLEAIHITINLERDDAQDITHLRRAITFKGDLTDEQRQRLLAIAEKCPVHKILTNPISIHTELK